MKKSKMVKSELPDCVKSYIFSKLSLKDLLKTSALSKRWHHEWGFITMDINFDLHTMFDNTLLPKSLPLFQDFQSQFATRLDQFILHHQGDMIHSIRVDFPLSDQHSDIINRMISKGISKGVKHIELLFSHDDVANDLKLETKPYKFSFNLLSDTDSLMYLHLEKCLIEESTNMSGLKNLRTLVLHEVVVNQDMIQGLFSNCVHLEDFILNACKLKSDLKIISSTLRHLNIVHYQRKRNIDIVASNLASVDYSYNHKYAKHTLKIKADMLSKFSYKGSKISNRLVGYSGMRNMTTIVLDGLNECLVSKVFPLLFSECLQLEDVTFKNCRIMQCVDIINAKLRCLNMIDCGDMDILPWFINIDAPNLSSFEYVGHTTKRFFVKAPRLLKVFWNAAKRDKNPYPFGPIARLHHIQNLVMIINPSQITELSTILVRFQNLRQLELFIEGAYDFNMDYFWILDIAMASQHLEKLSVTIRHSNMENYHMDGFKRQRREYAKFSHNNFKYVELCGCVCTINAIELASQILKNANSLQQITFTPRDKFYIGAGEWTESSDGCWFEQNLIHEMLKDNINEQCRLRIL